MLHEAVADVEGVVGTLFQLSQEELAVELIDLFQIAKHHIAFATQGLWHILPRQLWHVVLNDKLQGPDIVSLSLYHLSHEQTQCSVHQECKVSVVTSILNMTLSRSL